MYISDSVKYVGVNDTDIDLFESQYPVEDGISYNSYVIFDNKTAVMDTVDKRKTDEWLKNLEDVSCEPDYLVIHHIEPDHAGSIGAFCEKYPNAKLVSNAKTFAMLPQFFEGLDLESKKVVVADGDTLSLGTHTLKFIFAPMVHWPEVMLSYEESENLLFSADAFGKFGALTDEEDDDWACEARRYYFNIVGKYGAPVSTLLKKASALDIKKILPLHGPVLDKNLEYYIGKYTVWSSYECEDKGFLVAYASIHGNTAEAAEFVAKTLEDKGEMVELFDLCRCDTAEAIEAAFRYDRAILLASSYDGGVFLPMEDFLIHLRSKAYQKRRVALVQNGAWGPTAIRAMKPYLENMKEITLCEKEVTLKSILNESAKKELLSLIDEMM